jgi:hypothetical protein
MLKLSYVQALQPRRMITNLQPLESQKFGHAKLISSQHQVLQAKFVRISAITLADALHLGRVPAGELGAVVH